MEKICLFDIFLHSSFQFSVSCVSMGVSVVKTREILCCNIVFQFIHSYILISENTDLWFFCWWSMFLMCFAVCLSNVITPVLSYSFLFILYCIAKISNFKPDNENDNLCFLLFALSLHSFVYHTHHCNKKSILNINTFDTWVIWFLTSKNICSK